MSYFGHSLILFLDENNLFFSPVVSVLAPLSQNESKLKQTIKGTFSNIGANVELIPFHKIITHYSYQDARELRLVRLNPDVFNEPKLINYFNELSKQDLGYNFFTNNCSTYI
jgi:hypothetical protein